MSAALAVGVLVAGGVYLILQRGLIRVAFGFVLLGHAVNVLLVSAGGMARRGAPLAAHTPPDQAADPLPQAFVLTAIVITFGITVYLLALARLGGDDSVADRRSGEDADGGPEIGPETRPADQADQANRPYESTGPDDVPGRGGPAAGAPRHDGARPGDVGGR
jgi:multicomponent Na+:H+ antiporter subunit C